MSEPFLGELRVFSFNFPPKGWAACNGTLMPINQNQALFSLLGTMYGGNGQTTFGLPDLRGRVPIHVGGGFTQGERAGEENHTLTIQEMPQHLHTLQGSTDTNTATTIPSSHVLGPALNAYAPATSGLVSLAPDSVTGTGGSQPHINMQPYTVLNICIALQGIFPSQN